MPWETSAASTSKFMLMAGEESLSVFASRPERNFSGETEYIYSSCETIDDDKQGDATERTYGMSEGTDDVISIEEADIMPEAD